LLQLRNIFAIFLVSGFWHGANWTFIFWGFIHALTYIPLVFIGSNRTNLNTIAEDKLFPSFIELLQVLRTVSIVTIAWVFFRANNITEGFSYLGNIIQNWYWDHSFLTKVNIEKFNFLIICILIIAMYLSEWINRKATFGLENLPKNRILRNVIYLSLCLLVLQFFYGKNEFIYFQF
jgi:D-alanyl-lipoteichoic acid acyltransferase DltB (MBOAT superfamily)